MMTPSFKDHFSGIADRYVAFRPRYPDALFDYLAGASRRRELAWDCACGSGQATQALADRFISVIATDASQSQVAAAPSHPRIDYRVAPAEESGLPSGSVDLVTVAQALHWFDIDRFYAEVRRVLVPGGLLAVWAYGVLHVEDREIDALVTRFYRVTLGPYWPPERELVEKEYRTLPFPFRERRPPSFRMEALWSLPQLLGYFRSWSATSRYIAAHGDDPVSALADALSPLWGDPDCVREITWPLFLRVGED